MAIHASVALFKNEFVATLSDGRKIEQADWRGLAGTLYEAGVEPNDIEYEWQAGQRMITAGQQVALRAEIRRLKRESNNLGVAA